MARLASWCWRTNLLSGSRRRSLSSISSKLDRNANVFLYFNHRNISHCYTRVNQRNRKSHSIQTVLCVGTRHCSSRYSKCYWHSCCNSTWTQLYTMDCYERCLEMDSCWSCSITDPYLVSSW